jgi:hypothetical protein
LNDYFVENAEHKTGGMCDVVYTIAYLPVDVNAGSLYIVTCMEVHVTKMTGSSSDDWILLSLFWLQPFVVTLTYMLSLFHTLYSPPLHMH